MEELQSGWWELTPGRRYLVTANPAAGEIRRWDVETGESIVLPVFGDPQPRTCCPTDGS